MSMTDEEIFGANAPSGGGGKLDLPDAPWKFVRWASEKDERGDKKEYYDLALNGVVVAYHRRQQWDAEKKKFRVQSEKLIDEKTPNPRAGEPKYETVHYVLDDEGTIWATSIYGTMYGSDAEPGPYSAAIAKAGFEKYDKPIGMKYGQKFTKKDGQRRVFAFRFAKPDPADKARVVEAHIKVLEHIVLVEAAYAGAQWYRKATTEEKASAAALLEVIERKATATAKLITPAESIAKQTVAKVLPIAMELATSSAAAPGSDAPPHHDTDETATDDGWD